VAVFTLDADQITGLSNANIQINVPQDMVYVINVINADGKTLFGGNGMNFNSGQNNDKLLWNIVADNDPGTSRTVALGTNFYGSILAPMIDLTNGSGGEQNYVNGQVVAASYTHQGAEVHHVKFTTPASFSAVPEPATWSVFGLAGCGVMMGCRRRRRVR
jgi:choice-of-anchor A domain-containing protein